MNFFYRIAVPKNGIEITQQIKTQISNNPSHIESLVSIVGELWVYSRFFHYSSQFPHCWIEEIIPNGNPNYNHRRRFSADFLPEQIQRPFFSATPPILNFPNKWAPFSNFVFPNFDRRYLLIFLLWFCR